VAAYSTRAKAGAPVSVPLGWDELKAEFKSDYYTVTNVRERLSGLKIDPWNKYWTSQQRLSPQAIQALQSGYAKPLN
jgi:bifunctional non-homologous end joining protein LigD